MIDRFIALFIVAPVCIVVIVFATIMESAYELRRPRESIAE